MGWYGDYSSANEVIEEKKGYAKNGSGNRRYQSNEDLWNYPFSKMQKEPTILTASSLRDEMYKPIYFLNDSPAYF